ncbi:MAG: pyrimidine dimer DNA glycosylase/endonuclease V [Deltaproteobacteria bacterium]|nr:pyrimidine dimer DNA glycosylase/endonuclease V [Deltaproteobacteria bacterium]
MRLWSLHPRYLDPAGLVALWREALLARAVLRGATRGYRSHPQLLRFRNQADPEAAIAAYLGEVLAEAKRRGYRFDAGKIGAPRTVPAIPVTCGQLCFERDHLLKKLTLRNPAARKALRNTTEPVPHPLFTIVPGKRESWEKTKER